MTDNLEQDRTLSALLKTAHVPGSTVWADSEELADYTGLTWNRWHDQERADTRELFLPDYLSGSDYSGSAVERSNYRVFREEFSESHGVLWWDVSGGHATFGVVIAADCEDSGILETLEALGNYPLIDDSDHSELEQEEQNEQWESNDRVDFTRELESRTDGEYDLSDVADSEIDSIFWETSQDLGLYYECDGSGYHLDIEAIAEAVDVDIIKALPGAVPEYDSPDGQTPSSLDPRFVQVWQRIGTEGIDLAPGIGFGNCSALAVHRSQGSVSRSWNVTHRPTGLSAVSGLDSREHAETIARTIALEYNWEFTRSDSQRFRDQSAAMHKRITELRLA